MSRRAFASTMIEELIRQGKTTKQICKTKLIVPPPTVEQVQRVRKLYCSDMPAPEVPPDPAVAVVIDAYASGERGHTALARRAGVSRRRVARYLQEARAAGQIE